jgi:hypothetical protein
VADEAEDEEEEDEDEDEDEVAEISAGALNLRSCACRKSSFTERAATKAMT